MASERAIDRLAPTAVFAVSAATYALFSLTRHAHFGSGSWDLGCYTQSIWLAGHGRSLVSTLLGEVHALGDHFIPIIYLLGPLSWFPRSAAVLLWLQALAVASIAFPLYWLSRRAGLGVALSLALAIAFL